MAGLLTHRAEKPVTGSIKTAKQGVYVGRIEVYSVYHIYIYMYIIVISYRAIIY